MPSFLENVSAEYVEIHTRIEVTDEVHSALVDTFGKQRRGLPKGGVNFSGIEVSGEDVVHSDLWVASHEERTGLHHVLFEFILRRRGESDAIDRRRWNALVRKGLALREALAGLGALSLRGSVHCTVSWRFSTESVSSFVKLPLLAMDVPGTSFGHIVGVRFAPFDGDAHEYVSLDLVGEESLYLACHFVLASTISPDLLGEVVRRGEDLKGAFVKHRNDLAGEG